MREYGNKKKANRVPVVDDCYLSSTKGRVPVVEMATPHLVNAIKATERQLGALRKELKFREFVRKL